MPTLWATFFVMAAGLSDGYGPEGPAKSNVAAVGNGASSPRQGYQLRDAVRAALRQWARPSDEQAPQAAQEFLLLYQDVQADTQLARSQRETLRAQVRNRLAQLSDQIAYRLAREKRLAKAEQPKSVADPAGKTAPLAQQMGGMGGVGRPRANQGAGLGPQGGVRRGTIPDAGQDLVDPIHAFLCA